MGDQTATEAELGSGTDLLALVQGKPWKNKLKARTGSEDTTLATLTALRREDVTRTSLA